MTVHAQWNKESREFWRTCPCCGDKHCCKQTPYEQEQMNAIPTQGREQRADESRPPKRRSRALVKAKAAVVAKKSARKKATKTSV